MTEEKQSSKSIRKGQKQLVIGQIADHIIEQYKPQSGPVVLMWREVMNAFHLKLNPDSPVWVRDDQSVHDHWKRYGPGVVKILKDRRFTVVKVSRAIRGLVGHGRQPDRGGRRTDQAYKDCLPSASNMVFGIVVFPRDTQEDHPLIVESRDRRCKRDATSLTNGVDSVRDANDLGNLSDGTCEEIIDGTHAVVQKAFTAEKYPLFKGMAALPPAESKPLESRPSNPEVNPD
jgi:hypothetical protein